jgi:hypothetical protein
MSGLCLGLALLVGCGGDGGTGPGTDPLQVSPETRVVAPALLENVDVRPDRLVFTDEAAGRQGWKAGDILAGSFVEGSTRNPFGFLRRVTSIEMSDGAVVVTTSEATLEEAIVEGSYARVIDLEEDTTSLPASGLDGGMPEAGADGPQATMSALTLADGFRIGPTGKQFETLGVNDTGDVDISGSFGWDDFDLRFSESIDVALDLTRHRITGGRLIGKVGLDLRMSPYVDVNVGWSSPKSPIRTRADFASLLSGRTTGLRSFKYERPFRSKLRMARIGTVPVVYSIVGGASLTCGVNIGGSMKAGAGLGFTGMARAGLTLADGKVDPILDGSVDFALTPMFSSAAQASLECKGQMKVGLRLYGLVSLNASLDPYASLTSKYETQCSIDAFAPSATGQVELSSGLNASVTLESPQLLSVLGRDLAAGATLKTWPLIPEQHQPLASITQPAPGEHCPCGENREACCDETLVVGPTCDEGLVCAADKTCVPEDTGTGGHEDMSIKVSGSVARDGSNTYTFPAKAGYGVVIRVVDDDHKPFYPSFRVYEPGGQQVSGGSGQDVAGAAFAAGLDGTYSVVIRDGVVGGDGGGFTLYVVVAPGANKGGALTPGDARSGHIDEGIVDSYTFSALLGEGVDLRFTDVAATFVPGLTIYAPDGALVDKGVGDEVAATSFAAPQTGAYTAVLYDSSPGLAQTGDYSLAFTKAPGANKGGALKPGSSVQGRLTKGALDSYTFSALAGEGIVLRVADPGTGLLAPGFTIYRPDGSIETKSLRDEVAAAQFAAPRAGTYTVVVYDGSPDRAQTGIYNLYFSKAPGATTGGALVPGGSRSGHIDKGAVDSYTFDAMMGERVDIRVTDVAGRPLVPAFSVYGPDGASMAHNASPDVAGDGFAAAKSGTYTVIVYDGSGSLDQVGDYQLYFTKAPGAAKGGALTSGDSRSSHLDEGALDSYTIAAHAGDVISLILTDVAAGPLVPAFDLYGPQGALEKHATGADFAQAAYKAPSDGTRTIIVYDNSPLRNATGNYTLSVSATSPAP